MTVWPRKSSRRHQRDVEYWRYWGGPWPSAWYPPVSTLARLCAKMWKRS